MTPGKEEQLERLLQGEKMSPSFGVTLIKEGGEGAGLLSGDGGW